MYATNCKNSEVWSRTVWNASCYSKKSSLFPFNLYTYDDIFVAPISKSINEFLCVLHLLFCYSIWFGHPSFLRIILCYLTIPIGVPKKSWMMLLTVWNIFSKNSSIIWFAVEFLAFFFFVTLCSLTTMCTQVRILSSRVKANLLMVLFILKLQIADSLEQRFYKELRNENFRFVKIVMCIYRKFLLSCKEQMYVHCYCCFSFFIYTFLVTCKRYLNYAIFYCLLFSCWCNLSPSF